KFGGGNMKMWGCITSRGVGYATWIQETLNAEIYVSIVQEEFLNTLTYYHLDPAHIIFQQDNDPKHTSDLAMECFEENGVELLEWPSESPDLNPIEQMWFYLKQRLATYENVPGGIKELWERVEKEWEMIRAEKCVELIDSMPRR